MADYNEHLNLRCTKRLLIYENRWNFAEKLLKMSDEHAEEILKCL